jgi:hypothetical protein
VKKPAVGDSATGRAVADAWAWVTLLAILPLVLRMAGAAWGEPVAEDYDFLHRALLQGMGSLLDGGGSQAFWRPIPHQLYYAVFGRLLLAAPAVVAALHVALLAAGALLLYRALRATVSAPLASAAATFTLLSESTRTIASWPTQFVDLGLFFFSALALHEASRRRIGSALASLAAALLCKEVAVVTAVLLPFFPGAARDKRERTWLALGSAAVLAAWGAATLVVRQRAHLELPARIAGSSEALEAQLPQKLAWALSGSWKALASLPAVAGARGLLVAGVAVALALAAAVLIGRNRKARERFSRVKPLVVWGGVWFALATASLAPIFPSWQPNRSQFGGIGFGVGATAFLGAAHPALAGVLVAGRLTMLVLAPGAARSVPDAVPEAGAFMDYARLTRLQRFMRAARRALAARTPPLPPHAIVVQHNLPHGVEYAFGGDHALQVWTRDSTAHWMRFDAFQTHPETDVTVLLEGTYGHEPPVALVEPEAMRALFRAQAFARAGRIPELVAELDRADSLQLDPHAVAFRVTSQSWRAYAEATRGHSDIAEAIVRPLLSLQPADPLSRQVLALALAARGRFADAAAQLDSLERFVPGDPSTSGVRAEVERMRQVAGSTVPAIPVPPPVR